MVSDLAALPPCNVACLQQCNKIYGRETVHKICSSHVNDRTEIRIDCIISGPSVHGRG
jgi:hypothetical protein